MSYEFDTVFGPDAPTVVVYQRMGTPIVQAAMDGFNG